MDGESAHWQDVSMSTNRGGFFKFQTEELDLVDLLVRL
jgi:hypothetical protein